MVEFYTNIIFGFSSCLTIPVIKKGSVIVMDKASFHRQKQLICATQKAGCSLIFLPPYSPQFNPIEKFWSWLKRYLRKILPFNNALHTAFQVV